MSKNLEGIILSGLGGLYSVKTDGGEVFPCRAKGAFRKAKMTPLVGDRVSIRPPEVAGEEYFIEEIFTRKNALIRPAMANLETLFVTFAPKNPEPSTLYLDKLLSIAVYNRITPVIVITKQDISPSLAEKYAEIYRKTGHKVFLCSSEDGAGIDALAEYVHSLKGICAFAGASGVGKSTLMNRLFPHLSLQTGKISQKIERGRHTTRSVKLYEVMGGYLADTPGFSMLDFERFDFFGKDDLADTFREFRESLGECRYKKCTHLKEDGCAVIERVRAGEIAPSRHQSYCELYEILKNKHDWDKR
jgi:ribosome biogenesis GTPase